MYIVNMIASPMLYANERRLIRCNASGDTVVPFPSARHQGLTWRALDTSDSGRWAAAWPTGC